MTDFGCLQQAQECLRTGHFAEAEHFLRTAIAHDARLALAYDLLGKLLYRDSRAQEAAAIYRDWLQAIPSDPVAAHMVAATGGAPAPARASDDFIASVFGRAAMKFDAALADLGYRAPQLVLQRAVEVFDNGPAALNVLDLGCGTGLCGEWLRPVAGRLVGVDLSSGMLAEARKRGCYDELVCSEITAFLENCGDSFDLVVAADVLCYFGDLAMVCNAMARRLQPNGCVIFSLEELAEIDLPTGVAESATCNTQPGNTPLDITLPGNVPPGLALREHGRYAHAEAYVKRLLLHAGLTPLDTRRDMLRFERGAPVDGLIMAARAGAPT